MERVRHEDSVEMVERQGNRVKSPACVTIEVPALDDGIC